MQCPHSEKPRLKFLSPHDIRSQRDRLVQVLLRCEDCYTEATRPRDITIPEDLVHLLGEGIVSVSGTVL